MNYKKNNSSQTNTASQAAPRHLRLVYSEQNEKTLAEKRLVQRTEHPLGQSLLIQLSGLATALEKEVEKLSSL